MLLITEESSESHPSNGELNDFQIFEPYLEELNRHIAITASNNYILRRGAPGQGVYKPGWCSPYRRGLRGHR
jgi:hypothetical protein